MRATSRILRGTSIAVMALVLGAGCGSSSEPPGPAGDEVRSDKQRVTSPQVAAADFEAQVAGDNAFAFDLFQQIRGKDENLFYSPHSMSIALAMLQAGARGTTEQAIAKAMHYVLPQDRLHPVLDKLDLELLSRGQGAKAADGKAFRLNVVNALWGDRGYPFLPDYLDLLALNYGAGLRVLDLSTQCEASRQTINDWVAQQTEDRIKDLLPQGSIDDTTRLVLTNAIYFNAAWAVPFEESATKDAAFHLADGTTKQVPMMSGQLSTRYAKDAESQSVELVYDGGELSMLVIVPEPGALEPVQAGLSSQKLDAVLGALAPAQVQLSLPRFQFEAPLGLKASLSALGMAEAFTPAADFSGIDGKRDLVVQDVLHKGFIKVNEAGTEAAAATAVIVGDEAAPVDPPVTLVIDRPFLFVIRDHATGAVLFVGRVLDPT